MVNSHLLDRTSQCETLDLYQREEIRLGTAPDLYSQKAQRDFEYIQAALTALDPLAKQLPNVSEEIKESTQARLIHLHNRARRIATKTRSQFNLREALTTEIVAAQYLWHAESNSLSIHRNNQSTPEGILTGNGVHIARVNNSSPANVTQLAQQPTPTLNVNQVTNSTDGGVIRNNSYSAYQQPTINDYYEDPINHYRGPLLNQYPQSRIEDNKSDYPRNSHLNTIPSAMRKASGGAAPERIQQLRFAENTNNYMQARSLSPAPHQVHQYLNNMAETYSHAAELFENDQTRAPISSTVYERVDPSSGVSRAEHQALISQMINLQNSIKGMHLPRNEWNGNPREQAHRGEHLNIDGPENNHNHFCQNDVPNGDQDPENTVYRYGNTSTRFASRKQISPDHWGFCFSGENTGNKRDTTAQNFLSLLESNRLSEGYSKATMMTYLNVLLNGTAQIWWTCNRHSIATYEMFIEEFKVEYFPKDFEETAFIELCAYKQKEEPVMKYLTAFQTRLAYCKPPPSDYQVICILKRNVRSEFQTYLSLKDPRTFRELKLACKEKQEIDERAAGSIKSDVEKPKRNGKGKFMYALDLLGLEVESDDEEPTVFEVCYMHNGNDNNAPQRREFRCFNCDKLGHLWRKCPTKIVVPFCMYCGKKGTKITDCPEQACKDFYQRRVARRAERANQDK